MNETEHSFAMWLQEKTDSGTSTVNADLATLSNFTLSDVVDATYLPHSTCVINGSCQPNFSALVQKGREKGRGEGGVGRERGEERGRTEGERGRGRKEGEDGEEKGEKGGKGRKGWERGKRRKKKKNIF